MQCSSFVASSPRKWSNEFETDDKVCCQRSTAKRSASRFHTSPAMDSLPDVAVSPPFPDPLGVNAGESTQVSAVSMRASQWQGELAQGADGLPHCEWDHALPTEQIAFQLETPEPCTPTDVATTQWRTFLCPHAPRTFMASHGIESARTTPSTHSGLMTPADRWPFNIPSPTDAVAPMRECDWPKFGVSPDALISAMRHTNLESCHGLHDLDAMGVEKKCSQTDAGSKEDSPAVEVHRVHVLPRDCKPGMPDCIDPTRFRTCPLVFTVPDMLVAFLADMEALPEVPLKPLVREYDAEFGQGFLRPSTAFFGTSSGKCVLPEAAHYSPSSQDPELTNPLLASASTTEGLAVQSVEASSKNSLATGNYSMPDANVDPSLSFESSATVSSQGMMSESRPSATDLDDNKLHTNQ